MACLQVAPTDGPGQGRAWSSNKRPVVNPCSWPRRVTGSGYRGRVSSRRTIVPLLALALLLPGTAGCLGCPAALLSGTLADHGGELVVVNPGTPVVHVQWPFGDSVREVDGRLSVVDALGSVQAAEGDQVRIGGGLGSDDTWTACGSIERIPAPTPQEA